MEVLAHFSRGRFDIYIYTRNITAIYHPKIYELADDHLTDPVNIT